MMISEHHENGFVFLHSVTVCDGIDSDEQVVKPLCCHPPLDSRRQAMEVP